MEKNNYLSLLEFITKIAEKMFDLKMIMEEIQIDIKKVSKENINHIDGCDKIDKEIKTELTIINDQIENITKAIEHLKGLIKNYFTVFLFFQNLKPYFKIIMWIMIIIVGTVIADVLFPPVYKKLILFFYK
jgi:Mg2+ and Co2+ transporter CorA